jgi:hypothetical protein
MDDGVLKLRVWLDSAGRTPDPAELAPLLLISTP